MNDFKALIDLIDMRWFLVMCLVVIDAWSIRLILKSKAPLRETIWWSVIVVLCPIVGCLFWYTLGPKPLIPLPDDRANASAA